jgi:hypothetical protein
MQWRLSVGHATPSPVDLPRSWSAFKVIVDPALQPITPHNARQGAEWMGQGAQVTPPPQQVVLQASPTSLI